RKKWFGWADLIYLPDNSRYIDMVEPYRQIGYPVWSANRAARDWELDRAKGQAVFKAAGIQTIQGKEFRDHDAAIAYVRKQKKPFASKPSGPATEADKSLSYVAEQADDLIYMLEKWKKDEKLVANAREYGFILQEKKTGCEMGVSGWF